ncbi:MAG: hypothetical protein AAGB48_07320 [Planctomycetota bacterium]
MIWFWLGVGGLMLAAGLWFLALARRSKDRVATHTALGLALGFGGYHLASYLGPPGWLVFRVDPDFWWLVVLGCLGAVLGSLVTDRLLSDRPGEGG